jgi:curved DNA-binding protein CbpA
MAEGLALDPYRILGIPHTASPLQVARAHRRLAKQYHPDLHPGEDVSERMRHINEAWEILSSPSRRAVYDLDHPFGGGATARHWGTTRSVIRPQAPTTTRAWATWRATAAATQAAPRTRRPPGEISAPPTRRPPPIEPQQLSFLDSGWAAVLAAATILVLLAAAVVAGRLT